MGANLLEYIMKNRIIFSLTLLLLFVSSLTAAKAEKVFKNNFHHSNCLDNVVVEIENDILILTCEYDRGLYVEITHDHKLFVSGKRVQLNRYQRNLVEEYYDHFMEIMDRAKEIGLEGAKIGIEGAKIGFLAAKGAMKLLVSEYDQEDFEREIERESEKLEIRTEEIEEMVDDMEEVADEFEELHYTMKSDIDELNDLDWF